MGVIIPWVIAMGLQAYAHGINPKDRPPQLPEPYWFIVPSLAFGAIGVLATANRRVGTLFAWALLIGALVADYTARQNAIADAKAKTSSPPRTLHDATPSPNAHP